MKKNRDKAFTIVELIIVIAILSILFAIIIPKLTNSYRNIKSDIIDIYNGNQMKVVKYHDEVIYEGQDTPELDGYKIVNIDVKDNIIYIEVDDLIIEP